MWKQEKAACYFSKVDSYCTNMGNTFVDVWLVVTLTQICCSTSTHNWSISTDRGPGAKTKMPKVKKMKKIVPKMCSTMGQNYSIFSWY